APRAEILPLTSVRSDTVLAAEPALLAAHRPFYAVPLRNRAVRGVRAAGQADGPNGGCPRRQSSEERSHHVARSRSRRSALRRLSLAGALTLRALAFPASALAHTPAATVSCTGAHFSWVAFAPGSNTVHWRVTVDGAVVKEGTTVLSDNGGRSGSLDVPFTLNGTHVVAAFSWWFASDTADGNARAKTS